MVIKPVGKCCKSSTNLEFINFCTKHSDFIVNNVNVLVNNNIKAKPLTS